MDPPFERAGHLSAAAYERRRDATTARELGKLFASPSFTAWQEARTKRELRLKTASNVLLAAACVAVIAAPVPRAVPVPLPPAVAEPCCLPVPPPALAAHRPPSEVERALRLQLDELEHELDTTREELEVALDRTSELGLALVRAAEAAKYAEPGTPPPACTQPATVEESFVSSPSPPAASPSVLRQRGPAPPLRRPQPPLKCALVDAPAADNATLFFDLSSILASQRPSAKSVPRLPALERMPALPAVPALLFIAASVVVGACAALAAYARSVRRVQAAEQRSQALKAHLNEADFARETAEQLLRMVEEELQRKMQQLDEAQRAAAVASPCVTPAGAAAPGGALPPAPTPGGGGLVTPRAGELPPPPAHLVERFLRERNAVAIDQDQLERWLDMEEQFEELQESLARTEAASAHKDSQLASLGAARDEQLAQVRAWLDEAQDQLMTTQAALQEREAECRALSDQLTALAAGGQAAAEVRGQLLQRNLELAAQLEHAASEQDSLAQLSAAGYQLVQEVGQAGPLRSATPEEGSGDLTSDVNSVLELMRATRASLADRLAHSQQACEHMIRELRQGAHAALGGGEEEYSEAQGQASGEEAAPPAVHEADGEGGVEPAVLGASSRHNSQPLAVGPASKCSKAGWGHEAAQQSAENELPALGSSGEDGAENQIPGPDEQNDLRALESSGEDGAAEVPALEESAEDGAACRGSQEGGDDAEAARAWVRQLHANHAPFDIGGFLTALGCEGVEQGAPVSREEFEALRAQGLEALEAMADADHVQLRVVAAEAAALLQGWAWPVANVVAPPPTPSWFARLGLGG
eukprot:scaffold29.g5914.t1